MIAFLDGDDEIRFTVGPLLVGVPYGPEFTQFLFVLESDPLARFWGVCCWLSWVAKRCGHMVITEVDAASGTVTMSSGVGI